MKREIPVADDNKGNKRMVERIYEKFGPFYNLVFSKLLFQEGREVAIDFLEIEPGHKLLEVGVGTGLSLPIYPEDCEVVGVDLSRSMLKEAEKLIEKRKIRNAKVKKMDALNLQFPDNSFDGVLGNLFISATSDPRKALLEMKRVCKPGGHLVLMNHFKSNSKVVGGVETIFNPVAQRLGFNSNLEMGPLLNSVGLKVKEKKRVNAFNLWTAVSLVNEK